MILFSREYYKILPNFLQNFSNPPSLDVPVLYQLILLTSKRSLLKLSLAWLFCRPPVLPLWAAVVAALMVMFLLRLTLTDTHCLQPLFSSQHDGLLAVRKTLPGLGACLTHNTTQQDASSSHPAMSRLVQVSQTLWH